MPKLKATIKFGNKKALAALIKEDFVNQKLVDDTDRIVTKGIILNFISKGISPVRGFGRFGEYLNPSKYPGKGKNRLKPKRPVNLQLTGEMLRNYITFDKNPRTLSVGIRPTASDFVKTKAKAHNFGTETKSGVGAIPRRRFIPQKGEQWAVSVVRGVKILFTRRLRVLLSKK